MLDELKHLDKQYVLHTYNRSYIHFTHGDGAKIYDDNGEEYIDFGSGIGVNSLGYNNEKLTETIINQASKLIHVSNLFLIESQIRLAQKLIGLSGYNMRVFFSNSGLEANECAIKIARKYGEKTNRFKIITIKDSFHGRSIATLKASGQEKMHKHFGPFPDGFLYANDIDDAINIAKQDKQTIAIFIELIKGEGGICALPKDKVRMLQRRCNGNDILLMIDEVQTGIYRSGEFLASHVYEIYPDVITMAKGLGGGVPIGATITNKKEIFENGDHGSTFGGNYLSTAAGICVLEELEHLKQSGQLDSNVQLFNEKINNINDKYNNICKGVSGVGFMRGIKIITDDLLNTIINEARLNKLLVLKSGNATLRFLPPITITDGEISEGFSRLEKTLKAINDNL